MPKNKKLKLKALVISTVYIIHYALLYNIFILIEKTNVVDVNRIFIFLYGLLVIKTLTWNINVFSIYFRTVK
jgi:hypothetical protein